MADDAAEKLMNDEADRFLNDLFNDELLRFDWFYLLYGDHEPDQFESAVEDWLRKQPSANGQQGYETDLEHVKARSGRHMEANLGLWRGYHRLAARNGQLFTLRIRYEQEEKAVLFEGQPVADFSFKDRTLSWSSSGASQGNLVFSSLWDQPPGAAGAYIGPFCQGSVTLADRQAPVDVVGKMGVFSTNAILGGYGATDALDHWSGRYRVYKSKPDELPIDAGELVIGSPSDPAGAVVYGGTPVKQFEYEAGLLSWPAQIDNEPLNNSLALFKFTQLPDGRKCGVGSIRLSDDSEPVTAYAMLTESAPPKRNAFVSFAEIDPGQTPLTITTAAFPAGKVGEIYQASAAAAGGKPPYTWTLTARADLPSGLEDRGQGRITGTPSKAGQYDIGFTVTDAAGGSATKSIPLTVADKAADPALAEARAWLLPVLTALLGFGSAFALYKIKEKADEAKEAKKKVEKQEPSLFDRTLSIEERRSALFADREARIEASRKYVGELERKARTSRQIVRNLMRDWKQLIDARQEARNNNQQDEIDRLDREIEANVEERRFYEEVIDDSARHEDAPGAEEGRPLDIRELDFDHVRL